MKALNHAPLKGDTVRIPVTVRRRREYTAATVRGVRTHDLLVQVNGEFRYVDPAQVRR